MVTLHSLNPINTIDAQNDAQNEAQKITIVDLTKTEIRKNPSTTREELAKKL